MLRVRDAMPAPVAAVDVKRLHAQLMVDRCLKPGLKVRAVVGTIPDAAMLRALS